jgi:polyhydroxyalkanoate synthesis regulator phasin
MKIVEKLSTYAALIGVIGAIGGGFYTWGQFNTRLDVIEKKKFVVNQTVDLGPINKKVDDALIYANEYKVDLIDRIKKVEDKIKPTDLSGVKKDISKIREEIAALDIPKATDLGPLNKAIKELETRIAELNQQVAIVSKENQLQDILIEEIKEASNNPLAN